MMTNEERALPKLTQCHLLTPPIWNIWDAACNKWLDAHHTAGAFLKPIPCLQQMPGVHLNILQMHWTYGVKDDRTQKAHATMDGSKQAAPWLHEAVKMYASCIDQSSMKLFLAIAAVQNKIISIADTTNAFQQSPPPTKSCFLEINDAY